MEKECSPPKSSGAVRRKRALRRGRDRGKDSLSAVSAGGRGLLDTKTTADYSNEGCYAKIKEKFE